MPSVLAPRPTLSTLDSIPSKLWRLVAGVPKGGSHEQDHERALAGASQSPHCAEAGARPAPVDAACHARRTLAQEATPGALSADLQQFADDTYAFVNSGYISLFIVTDEGVIATDPGSQSGPERAEAYRAAIASVTDQPVRYLIYSHDHADHATGGEIFADTATFISHRNAVEKLAALADPRTPVPEIAFNDQLTIELGGKTIELYYTGRNHSDNSIVLLYPERRLLFAVDFIPVNSLPYQNLPDAYPEEWVESLRWIEENLDFDVLVPGHPPLPGTKANVTGVREYLEDLMAAVRAAQDKGWRTTPRR